MKFKLVSSKIKSAPLIKFNSKIIESRFIIDDKIKILEIKTAPEKLNQRKFILFCRQIILFAKKQGIKKINLNLAELTSLTKKLETKEILEILVVNALMANYEFNQYKEKPKSGWNFVEGINLITEKNLAKTLQKAQIIGEATNFCRDLANTPGGDMTPKILANFVKTATRDTDIKKEILGEKEMKKLKMEAILEVSRGSEEEGKFIIMEHLPNKNEKPIVLVGKGITFDTGGVNIKPGDAMGEMNLDMSGGAAVIAAICAAARLGIKKNFVGLIPAVENMPSGKSYRPGDIIRSMSGKSIEVINTDAEGRIILADTLTYAERYNPRLIIDVATLTGAVLVALGERASAVFSNDDKIAQKIIKLGEKSGDYLWQFPLWEEYENEIKGNFGDVANLKVNGNSRYGGVIAAAMFLYQFSKKFPAWVHIDIASRMTAVHDEFLAKGAAGTPVRLLIKILEEY